MALRSFATLALSTSLLATPTLADITPGDAWNIWQAQAKALGLTLNADETRTGDTLQIGDMTLSATLPMDIATLSLSFPGPRFSPNGEGAVLVSLPAKAQGRFTASIPGTSDVVATFLMTGKNESIIMSGTPDVVTSRWIGDGMSVHLTGLSSGEEIFGDITAAIEIGPYNTEIITSISDTVAINLTSENDSYNITYEYTIGGGVDAIGETYTDSATGISLDYTLVLPLDGLEFMDLHNQLRDTLSLSVISDLATYQTKQNSTVGGKIVASITQAIADHHTILSLGRSGLGLAALTGPLVADVEIGEGESELALSFHAASIEGRLLFPLLKTDNPQNAHFIMDLQGIRFDPEFWRIIDAEGALDHAPMSLSMDMTGTVDILVDLLDFAVLMFVEDASEVIQPSS